MNTKLDFILPKDAPNLLLKLEIYLPQLVNEEELPKDKPNFTMDLDSSYPSYFHSSSRNFMEGPNQNFAKETFQNFKAFTN